MSRRPLALALALALPSAANATDLMQTYELARTGDPQLSIAESTRLIDKEGAVQARAVLLPQISGSAGYELTHSSRPGDPTGDGKSRTYGASVSQTIFDWSRIANLRGQRAISQAADYDLASANNTLITRTSAAYFNVLIGIESLAATLHRLENEAPYLRVDALNIRRTEPPAAVPEQAGRLAVQVQVSGYLSAVEVAAHE